MSPTQSIHFPISRQQAMQAYSLLYNSTTLATTTILSADLYQCFCVATNYKQPHLIATSV